jgi:hypothetical protein
MMFPGEFFYDATLLAFATVIVGAVAIGLVSFGLLRIKSHRAA